MSMRIGLSTAKEVARQIEGLIQYHEADINKAYVKCGEEDLAIAFKTKIKPAGNALSITTEISFTVEKLKDSASGRVSELPLFEENLHDRRTRQHVRWMVLGGEKKKGDFEDFLKQAA
jgi:hypothetical protein